MAKRKTTVSSDEQELEPVTGESTPVEGNEADVPAMDSDTLSLPTEDNLPGEEQTHEEESSFDTGAMDETTAPADEEPLLPSGEQAAEDAGYSDILQELGHAATEEAAPLVLEQSADAESPYEEQFSEDDRMLLSEGDAVSMEDLGAEPAAQSPSDPRRSRVLTIDTRGDIQTEAEREATIWHEIQNSYRTRRILTGSLDGVEKTESRLTLAVVNYKGFRVAIPVKEMMLHIGKMPSGREFTELMERLHRILNSRLGAEIDFVVKGYDNNTHSVVASRRDAMLRKRQTFYLDTDELGEHMIYEGRVVQARVVAVAEKVIRVEVFGVECSIVARGLSWEWIGNARDHFSVGDRILVRVLRIQREDLEHITIQVDARSVSGTNSHDNLKKCMPQCRYAGRVTDVRNGVVFIRLNNGVNAIAHSCYDLRAPGKNDDVSFAVTRLDEEQGVAIGIITRIIKQHL